MKHKGRSNIADWFTPIKRGTLFLCLLQPIAIVGFALYGSVAPWAAAEEALARYPGQTPVMVWGHFSRYSDLRGLNAETHVEREYVLLPSVFSDPRLIIVTKNVEDTISIEETPWGAARLLVLSLLAFAAGCWSWALPAWRNRRAGR